MKGLIDVLRGKEKIRLGSIKSSKSNLAFSKVNTGWGISKRSGVFDFDRDGVVDKLDCKPLDPHRQHRDPGDWMETKSKAPEVFSEDWMSTKVYKRRPRTEATNKDWIKKHKRRPRLEKTKRKISTEGKIIRDTLSVYTKFPRDKDVELRDMKLDIEEWADEMVERNQYSIYPYRKNTIVIYDRKKKVYHYFDWNTNTEEFPNLLFSISASRKKEYGEEKLMRFLRRV